MVSGSFIEDSYTALMISFEIEESNDNFEKTTKHIGRCEVFSAIWEILGQYRPAKNTFGIMRILFIKRHVLQHNWDPMKDSA